MKIYDHGHDEVGRTKAQTMKWNTTHLIQTMHYYSEQNIVYQLQTTIITFNVLHVLETWKNMSGLKSLKSQCTCMVYPVTTDYMHNNTRV